MTTHNFGEPTSAIKNQVGMIHHPNFTPEEKASMKCIGNCSISCSFHSRMGCSIDKGFKHVPTQARFVKHGEDKMVGRYKVKKGSR